MLHGVHVLLPRASYRGCPPPSRHPSPQSPFLLLPVALGLPPPARRLYSAPTSTRSVNAPLALYRAIDVRAAALHDTRSRLSLRALAAPHPRAGALRASLADGGDSAPGTDAHSTICSATARSTASTSELRPFSPAFRNARRSISHYCGLGRVLARVEPAHPVLRVLGATLEVFRTNEIPTLVYVVPVNVEHHEKIGAYSQGDLDPAVAVYT